MIERFAVRLTAVRTTDVLLDIFQRCFQHREPISQVGQGARRDDRLAGTESGTPPETPCLISTLTV